MNELILEKPENTYSLGLRIGASARGGTTLALRGGLGVGKTLLTKGIARGLGIEEEVTSPTYTIISEYEGRLRLHHVDAFRLGGAEDFEAVGGTELLSDPGGLTVIEWSERIADALPEDVATLELEIGADQARIARFSGHFADFLAEDGVS